MAKGEMSFLLASHRSGLALSLTTDELNSALKVFMLRSFPAEQTLKWNVKNIEQFALFLFWNPMLLTRNRSLW